MNRIKGWIGELTDITVALVALGVAAGVVFGMDVPFVGAVLGNLVDLINALGDAGVVGIIVLAILSGMYGRGGM
ncbi:MAG: hypothetical protein NZ731_03485 [Gammaproteobacteria bacterium]|jgi:hypothetical protein|uniref:Uncharacterized protein n=1 Tax=marine metagenome TaxID=408172 RepID=A0A381WKJ0_9ZZZZ|nr:hypothetical protein [Candidatus Nitrosopelagicus sp.]MCS5544975.1 hypothetical protein [Gammaproteobacteria bacterium]HIG35744.1 hypothetical protein [Gammaproteobacteria bacterium]HIN13500.1 hypothetical protein [Gammaproteobacteria bacterium]|tara:strand:- start:344 stop:565 length:222 start_codon:yes stop_codon:yes gene_type:complete